MIACPLDPCCGTPDVVDAKNERADGQYYPATSWLGNTNQNVD
jgi:hypothetical protein